MTVAYEVEGALYVNLTNRCNNNCNFCIRHNGDGAYGSDSLWLEREPTVDEAITAVLSHNLDKYTELVFCGYGEPSIRLDDCISVASAARRACPALRIRINTNGMSDLYFGYDTSEKYRGAFDTVSISLNAPNAAKYDEICHPVYHLSAFPAILRFAENVNKCVHKTVFTLVDEFLTPEEIEECRTLAAKAGIPLRIREYIS